MPGEEIAFMYIASWWSDQQQRKAELAELTGRSREIAEVGYRALARAGRASTEENRRDEISLARRHFADLAQIADSTDSASIREVAHHGNHWCFLLRDDTKEAALEAFRCTADFPDFGLDSFAPRFFSEPYRTQRDILVANIEATREQLRKGRKANAKARAVVAARKTSAAWRNARQEMTEAPAQRPAKEKLTIFTSAARRGADRITLVLEDTAQMKADIEALTANKAELYERLGKECARMCTEIESMGIDFGPSVAELVESLGV